jgi:hypothetical protein
MRSKRVTLFVIAITLITGLVYYQINYMSLWGFTLKKDDLNKVIIHSDGKVYMVTNRQIVLDLAEKASKMKRLQKVEAIYFPPGPIAKPFGKLMLQTSNNGTFGGTIWNLSSGNTLDSSGYYWNVTDEVISELEIAIKDSQTTNLP